MVRVACTIAQVVFPHFNELTRLTPVSRFFRDFETPQKLSPFVHTHTRQIRCDCFHRSIQSRFHVCQMISINPFTFRFVAQISGQFFDDYVRRRMKDVTYRYCLGFCVVWLSAAVSGALTFETFLPCISYYYFGFGLSLFLVLFLFNRMMMWGSNQSRSVLIQDYSLCKHSTVGIIIVQR